MALPLILLAESQEEVRRQVGDSLEQSGFRILPAGSAKDIWRAMETSPVGAVVLDTDLRGPDGADLCREVRALSDVPIILVGARNTEVDRVVGLELGADDYLGKPYSARELSARLRAVLRRGKKERQAALQRPPQLRFDGWLVDFARHEVRNPDGAPVDLTSAEFALLGILVDHVRRVVSRARLMELTGNRGSDTSDRSIDVLVSRLRRKLTHGDRVAPIVTVRGAGYMFSGAIEPDR